MKQTLAGIKRRCTLGVRLLVYKNSNYRGMEGRVRKISQVRAASVKMGFSYLFWPPASHVRIVSENRFEIASDRWPMRNDSPVIGYEILD